MVFRNRWSPVAAILSVVWCVSASAQQPRVLVLDRCPTKPPAAVTEGLLALFIPELISLGVDMAATALSEAAKTKEARGYAESSSFKYYQLSNAAELSRSTRLKCLVFVVGGDGTGTVPEWLDPARSVLNWLSSTPDMYLEIELLKREDNDGLLLAPRLIAVGKVLGDHGWWSRNERGYAVAVSLKDASTLEAFGNAVFSFAGVETGQPYTQDGKDNSSRKLESWPQPVAVPKLPENDVVKEAVADQKTAIATRQEVNAILKRAATPAPQPRKLAVDTEDYLKSLDTFCKTAATWNAKKLPPTIKDDRCPKEVFQARRDLAKTEETQNTKEGLAWAQAYVASVCKPEADAQENCALPAPKAPEVGSTLASVTVTETTEPAKFVQLLATAFNAKKADVVTALNDRLNPQRKAELHGQKSDSEREAREAYEIAILKVQQLEATLSEASDKPASVQLSIQIQLMQAKLDANKAARKAGKAVPYAEFN